MTEDGLYLLTHDPREPLQEFIDGGAALEVLEEGPNRDARCLYNQAPLTFPGMRSTAGHWLRSSIEPLVL